MYILLATNGITRAQSFSWGHAITGLSLVQRKNWTIGLISLFFWAFLWISQIVDYTNLKQFMYSSGLHNIRRGLHNVRVNDLLEIDEVVY